MSVKLWCSYLVLIARVIGLLSGLTRTLETRIDLVGAILPYVLPRPPKPPEPPHQSEL